MKVRLALILPLCGLILMTACTERVGLSHQVTVRLQAPESTGNPVGGIIFLLIDSDPNLVLCRVRLELRGCGGQEQLSGFRKALRDCSVAGDSTDADGRLTFNKVSPGLYWVVNPEPVRLGTEQISWAHPVTVPEKGDPREILLQRSNAALVILE